MNTDHSTIALSDAVWMRMAAPHVAWVCIDRPQARNAVNAAVAQGLEAAIDRCESDPDTWVTVLTGAGPDAFCAGADLKEVAAGRSDALWTERGGFAGITSRERTKPWIAAVQGKALAGGTEIALACDLIVASENAGFGLPEVLRGLIAAAGGLVRLPRAIPPRVAMEHILTGRPITVQQALQWGMVSRVVPSEALAEAALALANEIASNAPVAVRESLRLARLALDHDEAALRRLSQDAIERVKASEDFQEGPRAFIEKRAPRWTGR